jgi:UDP-N-acetylglucosamine 4,6-dehydratase/5-epimerase
MTTDSLLITGGTGTLGRALIRRALHSQRWGRVICYSRDEVKQAQLFDEFGYYAAFKLFLGDVRDVQRLGMAMRGVDAVVHAAALKRVDAGAYSPSEIVQTNVIGSMNVVNTAIQSRVGRVVVVSSDKAVAATNIYGASKFMAESYAVAANSYGYPSGTRSCAVRYGNVLGSRGSVVHVWRKQVADGKPLQLTSPDMTRFIMTIEQACDLIDHALAHAEGGEVFVPVLPAARMTTLAEAVAPGHPVEVTGLRPGGEKMAEALLNEEEPSRTVVSDEVYVVTPSHCTWRADARWAGDQVAPGFIYRSDALAEESYLSAQDLRALMAGTEALR